MIALNDGKGSIVYVPTTQAGNLLRPTEVAQTKIDTAQDVLRQPATTSGGAWLPRADAFTKKIHSGDIVAIAEVVRDTHRRNGDKPASHSEQQLYEKAIGRLIDLLAAARQSSKDKAVTWIDAALRTQGPGPSVRVALEMPAPEPLRGGTASPLDALARLAPTNTPAIRAPSAMEDRIAAANARWKEKAAAMKPEPTNGRRGIDRRVERLEFLALPRCQLLSYDPSVTRWVAPATEPPTADGRSVVSKPYHERLLYQPVLEAQQAALKHAARVELLDEAAAGCHHNGPSAASAETVSALEAQLRESRTQLQERDAKIRSLEITAAQVATLTTELQLAQARVAELEKKLATQHHFTRADQEKIKSGWYVTAGAWVHRDFEGCSRAAWTRWVNSNCP